MLGYKHMLLRVSKQGIQADLHRQRTLTFTAIRSSLRIMCALWLQCSSNEYEVAAANKTSFRKSKLILCRTAVSMISILFSYFQSHWKFFKMRTKSRSFFFQASVYHILHLQPVCNYFFCHLYFELFFSSWSFSYWEIKVAFKSLNFFFL